MKRITKIGSTYQEQLDLQQYAEHRRKEIQNFITKYNPRFLTLIEAIAFVNSNDPNKKGKLFAVIDPAIVASLSLIRSVLSIQELDDETKRWLIRYWEETYEIDVSPESEFPEWNYQASLLFWSSNSYYPLYYSYPSCLISTFLLIQFQEETVE